MIHLPPPPPPALPALINFACLLGYFSVATIGMLVLASCRLTDMLQNYEGILASVPTILAPLMRPFVDRVEEVLNVGVNTLSWTSLQHDDCESICRIICKLLQFGVSGGVVCSRMVMFLMLFPALFVKS